MKPDRVDVIGAGPAGLACATLFSDIGSQVTVYDRSSTAGSDGFGIVLHRVHARRIARELGGRVGHLVDNATAWDDLGVDRTGRSPFRLPGNPFCGVYRGALLDALTMECVDRNVRFVDSARTPAHFADRGRGDLVVDASGASDETHTLSNRPFPRTSFAWLATRRGDLDHLQLAFRDTEWGMTSAHRYPYSDTEATFVLELPDTTVRALQDNSMTEGPVLTDALLSHLAEKYCVKFLEDVRSPRLRTRSVGAHDPISTTGSTVAVKVGDAAHTVHFSVGSGTTLALEDAVVLRDSVVAAEHLDGGVQTYRAVRRRRVADTIAASWSSSALWASLDVLEDLTTEQLADLVVSRVGITSGHEPPVSTPPLEPLDPFRLQATVEPAQDPEDIYAPLVPTLVDVQLGQRRSRAVEVVPAGENAAGIRSSMVTCLWLLRSFPGITVRIAGSTDPSLRFNRALAGLRSPVRSSLANTTT